RRSSDLAIKATHMAAQGGQFVERFLDVWVALVVEVTGFAFDEIKAVVVKQRDVQFIVYRLSPFAAPANGKAPAEILKFSAKHAFELFRLSIAEFFKPEPIAQIPAVRAGETYLMPSQFDQACVPHLVQQGLQTLIIFLRHT